MFSHEPEMQDVTDIFFEVLQKQTVNCHFAASTRLARLAGQPGLGKSDPAQKSNHCFTVCLCISPDFDGYRALKMKHWPRKTHNRSRNLRRVQGTKNETFLRSFTICFMM